MKQPPFVSRIFNYGRYQYHPNDLVGAGSWPATAQGYLNVGEVVLVLACNGTSRRDIDNEVLVLSRVGVGILHNLPFGDDEDEVGL